MTYDIFIDLHELAVSAMALPKWQHDQVRDEVCTALLRAKLAGKFR